MPRGKTRLLTLPAIFSRPTPQPVGPESIAVWQRIGSMLEDQQIWNILEAPITGTGSLILFLTSLLEDKITRVDYWYN
jgi:hypothetical protein